MEANVTIFMSVLDFIPIVVVLLVFSITTMLGVYLLSEFDTATDGYLDTDAGDLAINNTNAALIGFDYLFIFILLGLAVGVLIGAFFIRTHPVFFFVSLFSLVGVLTLTAQFSNVFYAFATSPPIDTVSGSFTYMEAVWANMPTIIMILGILLIIVMYSKFRGGDQFS